jgi:hypothetical protein
MTDFEDKDEMLKKFTAADIHDEIDIFFPETLINENPPICINNLSEIFLDLVLFYADEVVDNYRMYKYSKNFTKPMNMTIRDLFLIKVVACGLEYDFNNVFLNKLLDFDKMKNKNVKLSTLLKHRFDGDVYNFNERNISFFSFKSSDLKMYDHLLKMMKFLSIRNLLYIDYPQYYKIINTNSGDKPLVQPYDLSGLHSIICKNKKGCIYYNNYWIGNEKEKSIHSNSIMAILSYLKFKHETIL